MSARAALQPVGFDALPGFREDDLGSALRVLQRSARTLLAGVSPLRGGRPASPALRRALTEAMAARESDAREFFEATFTPCRIPADGFVTAYYEPELAASRHPAPGFSTPALSRPADLVTLNEAPLTLAPDAIFTSARRRPDGRLEPYADRAAIEAAEPPVSAPLAYVRDAVELFMMQVQGSGSLVFSDGSRQALTYDGRNGHPYVSIGRLLLERGFLRLETMSLASVKQTLREMGVGPGEAGRRLMQENPSYVFFRVDERPERRLGPIGGDGGNLTAGRSIAVDRSLWAYGSPFWIAADLPLGAPAAPFRRLMIAQDTGSAIVGPARADLYLGSGHEAGERAGRIRHAAELYVLIPRGEALELRGEGGER